MRELNNDDYTHDAAKKWQDWCTVLVINDRLVALPYSDAKQTEEYEMGTTIAAISANRFIRKLVNHKG